MVGTLTPPTVLQFLWQFQLLGSLAELVPTDSPLVAILTPFADLALGTSLAIVVAGLTTYSPAILAIVAEVTVIAAGGPIQLARLWDFCSVMISMRLATEGKETQGKKDDKHLPRFDPDSGYEGALLALKYLCCERI